MKREKFNEFASCPSPSFPPASSFLKRGFKTFGRRCLIALYIKKIYREKTGEEKKNTEKGVKKKRRKIKRTMFYFRTAANGIGNNVKFFSTSRRASRRDKLRRCFPLKLLQPRLFRRGNFSPGPEQRREIGLKKTDRQTG